MEQFLGFALPGVPYGCTYALVAVCLVLTYQATGVFNFAFGAQAFASAFVFTYLTQYHNWSGFEAFLLSVVVLGPVMGWAFDRLIFRHIPNSNSHGEDGVQPGPAGRHPRRCSRSSSVPRTSTPPRPSCPSSTRTSCTSPSSGTPDQRDLPGDHLGHGRRAHPAHHPPALHEPRTADAGRGREPAPGPARRRQRQRRRGRGLDHLQLHGEPGRRAPGPGVRCLQLRRLRHADGDGHCRRGLGAAAIDADRRRASPS